MAEKLTGAAIDLRGVRRRCKMGPLEEDELEDFFVETAQGRDPERGLRHILSQKLEDEDEGNVRLLVHGHGGCGKSTELVKLVTEISPTHFCVPFSVRDEMNLADIRAEHIVLIMMEQLMACAKEAGLKVDDSDLEPILEFFTEVSTQQKKSRGTEVSASAKASVGTSVFAKLFSLLAEFKGEIKLSSNQEETRVAIVRRRPVELLQYAQVLVNSINNALPGGKQVLIIVEDLDKLDIASARKVFIENVNILAGVPGNVIYTIPIFTFHSNDAGILRSKFTADIALPMIKTMQMDGKERAPGFEIVKEILYRRIDPSLIDDEAIDLLIEKTGGVLQHAFEVLHTAASMVNAAPPLQKSHIEYGLQRKRNEFWAEIALPDPPPEDVSEDDLYNRLEEYAKRQLEGKKNQPVTNAINQILLKACALVEYNTERWLGVHPLVIDNLRELGRIK